MCPLSIASNQSTTVTDASEVQGFDAAKLQDWNSVSGLPTVFNQSDVQDRPFHSQSWGIDTLTLCVDNINHQGYPMDVVQTAVSEVCPVTPTVMHKIAALLNEQLTSGLLKETDFFAIYIWDVLVHAQYYSKEHTLHKTLPPPEWSETVIVMDTLGSLAKKSVGALGRVAILY